MHSTRHESLSQLVCGSRISWEGQLLFFVWQDKGAFTFHLFIVVCV